MTEGHTMRVRLTDSDITVGLISAFSINITILIIQYL